LAAAPASAEPAEVATRVISDDAFRDAVVASATAVPAELTLPVPGRELGVSLPPRRGPRIDLGEITTSKETAAMGRLFRLGSSPYFYGTALVLILYMRVRRRRRKIPPRIVLAWSPIDSPIFDATRPPFDRRA
jgi:hypothetical protein